MFARDTVYPYGVLWSVDVCHWPSVQLWNGDKNSLNSFCHARNFVGVCVVFFFLNHVTWNGCTSASPWKLQRLLGARLFNGNMDRNGDQGLCDRWWQMLKLSSLPEANRWVRSTKYETQVRLNLLPGTLLLEPSWNQI